MLQLCVIIKKQGHMQVIDLHETVMMQQGTNTLRQRLHNCTVSNVSGSNASEHMQVWRDLHEQYTPQPAACTYIMSATELACFTSSV